MIEIVHIVLEFIRSLTFDDVVMLMIKLIVICFVYVCVCEGIDALKWAINYFLVGVYNYYTTKAQRKVEARTAIPYKRASTTAGEVIDISNLITVTPKVIAKIDIMTGRVTTKQVWKKRGILGKFLRLGTEDVFKAIVAIPEKKVCKKSFIYTQSLVNTLNLHYMNWQELNKELWNMLSREEIVAEETITPYLCSFRH